MGKLFTSRVEPVNFLNSFTHSEHFEALYNEGMSLIEETVNYIDGEGREQSRALSTAGALAHVAESMRLTNRLMHMASWLFIHKAFKDKEISHDQFLIEHGKISPSLLLPYERSESFNEIPFGLRALIERSLRLLERITALNRSHVKGEEQPPEGLQGVHRVMFQLNQAFSE